MNELKYLLNITFIQENRYLLFLEGLVNTLLLTFGSFILGTAVGILLCMAVRSKNEVIRRVAGGLRSFFIQLPTMVLLMIMVYVIFGRSALPIIWVVIVGLTLKAAAFLSEIFETAVNTVSPGEIEAARTLGMTRRQAFMNVVLPQTLKAALPMYQSQFMSTMQETSVVGYLAVMDLTRAAAVVASRTLDAITGLLTVTLLYFIISYIIKRLFRLIFIRRSRGGETV